MLGREQGRRVADLLGKTTGMAISLFNRDGALLPAPRGHAVIPGRELGALGASHLVSQLRQAHAQGAAACAGFP